MRKQLGTKNSKSNEAARKRMAELREDTQMSFDRETGGEQTSEQGM